MSPLRRFDVIPRICVNYGRRCCLTGHFSGEIGQMNTPNRILYWMVYFLNRTSNQGYPRLTRDEKATLRQAQGGKRCFNTS